MPMHRTDASQGRRQAPEPDLTGDPPELQSWWALSDEMFGIVDSDGLLSAVNPAWERTLGHPAGRPPGHEPARPSAPRGCARRLEGPRSGVAVRSLRPRRRALPAPARRPPLARVVRSSRHGRVLPHGQGHHGVEGCRRRAGPARAPLARPAGRAPRRALGGGRRGPDHGGERAVLRDDGVLRTGAHGHRSAPAVLAARGDRREHGCLPLGPARGPRALRADLHAEERRALSGADRSLHAGRRRSRRALRGARRERRGGRAGAPPRCALRGPAGELGVGPGRRLDPTVLRAHRHHGPGRARLAQAGRPALTRAASPMRAS